MTRKHLSLALIALTMPTSLVFGFATTNFFKPYESATRLPDIEETSFRLGASNLEYGEGHRGRNTSGKLANILQLADATQSAISMLSAPVGSVKTAVAPLLLTGLYIPVPITDDGKRGHQLLTGDFRGFDATFFAGYTLPWRKIPGHLAFNLYVPVVWKEVDVNIQDITPTTRGDLTGAGDTAAKTLLTNDLIANVKKFGNLDLGKWSNTGVGDITFMVDWYDTYKQQKDYLDAVSVYLHAGVLFPSSEEKDEDKAFSLPMGFDGAWGLPIGLGLKLDLKHSIQLGADADFTILFDVTRDRRMKTARNQTEFLLLNKGRATKEYGLNWQFHVYLQSFHVWRGLSAKFAYQYIKHDEDRLVPKNNDFDSSIVNSANSLKEQAVHNLIFKVGYDFVKECPRFVPQISLFYKLPVAGKNYIATETYGGQIAVNF